MPQLFHTTTFNVLVRGVCNVLDSACYNYYY